MAVLIDTDVAVHVRDGEISIVNALARRGEQPLICMPTLVELQAGLGASPELAQARRAGLAKVLARIRVVDLTIDVVNAYGQIIAQIGFARTRVFDRLIAATALVHDLTLITINGADFRDIPGLKLEVWPAPDQ